MKSSLFACVVVMSGTLACPGSVGAGTPYLAAAVAFIGDYLTGKAIDAVCDKVTGKPDIRKLDERLKLAEDALNRRDKELASCVNELRLKVRRNRNMTREEYDAAANFAINQIGWRMEKLEKLTEANRQRSEELARRIRNLEERIGKLQEQSENAKALEYIEGVRKIAGEAKSAPRTKLQFTDEQIEKRRHEGMTDLASRTGHTLNEVYGIYKSGRWRSDGGRPPVQTRRDEHSDFLPYEFKMHVLSRSR